MKKSTARPKPRRTVAKRATTKTPVGSLSRSSKTAPRAVRKELAELRRRLEIAEMTLEAIRAGEADALVISGADGDRVFTLEGADQPYRVLIESMNEGALTVTPDGILLYCNRHFADLLGLPLEKVMGGSFYEVVPVSEHAQLEALLREGKLGASKTELTLSGPRGAISAQLSATALQVDGLEAVCIVVTDLTERRHSEKIIASENLARSILDQAAESIVVCDREGRITRANRSAVELCGQNPLLRQFDDAFPLRRIRHESGPDPSPDSGISGERETLRSIGAVLTRPNLPPVEVLISTGPLSTADGESLGRVITLTDISALARVERIQRFLAETSALLAQSLDLEDKLTSLVVRPVVAEFADWCSLEVIEQRGLVRAVASRKADQKVDVSAKVVEVTDDAAERFESLRRADAGVVHELRESALDDEARELYRRGARSLISIALTARGSAFGAITLASFDTDRTYGPQDLAFAGELGHRAATAIDNARLYREAQEAVKARDEFMSIAAHEMRTPLMALTLQLNNLMRLVAKGSAEAIELKIQKAIGQTDRLARLIDHLLDVSRIAAGRLVLESAECDLSEVVRESAERFTDEASRAGSELRMRLEPEVNGTWDSFRLEQMVTNLVSNAIKYGDGKPIEIVLETDSRGARLVVRDNGIGIAEKELPRVFEPFHRSTSVRRYSGLGLGLHITSQIVRAHGGEIQVKSELGSGSSFIVELPRQVPAPAPSAEHSSSSI
jgi:PAS domain S-box-containing protein